MFYKSLLGSKFLVYKMSATFPNSEINCQAHNYCFPQLPRSNFMLHCYSESLAANPIQREFYCLWASPSVSLSLHQNIPSSESIYILFSTLHQTSLKSFPCSNGKHGWTLSCVVQNNHNSETFTYQFNLHPFSKVSICGKRDWNIIGGNMYKMLGVRHLDVGTGWAFFTCVWCHGPEDSCWTRRKHWLGTLYELLLLRWNTAILIPETAFYCPSKL